MNKKFENCLKRRTCKLTSSFLYICLRKVKCLNLWWEEITDRVELKFTFRIRQIFTDNFFPNLLCCARNRTQSKLWIACSFSLIIESEGYLKTCLLILLQHVLSHFQFSSHWVTKKIPIPEKQGSGSNQLKGTAVIPKMISLVWTE